MRRSGPMTYLSRSFVALSLCTAMAWPAPGLAWQDKSLKEQQMDYAKKLYQEGEEALAKQNYEVAVKKFEEAYRYAPDLHVFNFNIANAAYAGGKCGKAKTYFQRFLDTVPDHPERTTAQEKLLEIERTGCAVEESSGTAATTTTTTPEEDPLAQQQEQEAQAAQAEAEADEPRRKKDKKPKKDSKYRFNKMMYIGLGVGGGGILVGLTGGVLGLIAWNNAKKLASLSGERGPFGFTPNEYDSDAYRMDVNRQRMGLTSYILMPVGAAALVAGLTLYFIGLKKCKAQFKGGGGGQGPVQARLGGIGPAAFSRGGGVNASFSFGLADGRRRTSATTCR